ncbi:DUF3810 family protein [Flavobacterium sp. XN-5]|nr:DUF3810 family protein [Flavobacterium sp. XN-5]
MKQKFILPFFLIVQVILLQIISFFPESVERYYSNEFYLTLSQFSRTLLGSIPFSLGDCLYFILIFLVLKWFWTKRKSWKQNWKDNSMQLFSFLSVFYFLFHILWALNYYRQPLFKKMEIEREYTDSDLAVFTKKLIKKTNEIQVQITKSDSLKVVFPYSQEQVFTMTLNGYKNLSKQHQNFPFINLSTKKSLFSLPLTYMGFGGYLNPFTNEAQVNYLGPMYSFPMTTNHEMAHQMGYASESECNFIGFLASVKNDNLYIKYSGYSYALWYCLGILEYSSQESFDQLIKTVHPGIIKNYKESTDFRKEYRSPIETGFHLFYDQFLKLNQQKDGIESYSKFVNLMVNYYGQKNNEL